MPRGQVLRRVERTAGAGEDSVVLGADERSILAREEIAVRAPGGSGDRIDLLATEDGCEPKWTVDSTHGRRQADDGVVRRQPPDARDAHAEWKLPREARDRRVPPRGAPEVGIREEHAVSGHDFSSTSLEAARGFVSVLR